MSRRGKEHRVFTLGAVEPGRWVAVLDEAGHQWWAEQNRIVRVQVARERFEAGMSMPPWFAEIIGEGMLRIARKLPFVKWGLGPLEYGNAGVTKQLGFWAVKQKIKEAITTGEVVVYHDEEGWKPGFRLKDWQRWVLVYGEKGYWLGSVSGAMVWRAPQQVWSRKGPFGVGEAKLTQESVTRALQEGKARYEARKEAAWSGR